MAREGSGSGENGRDAPEQRRWLPRCSICGCNRTPHVAVTTFAVTLCAADGCCQHNGTPRGALRAASSAMRTPSVASRLHIRGNAITAALRLRRVSRR
jgi:hypothetical protein